MSVSSGFGDRPLYRNRLAGVDAIESPATMSAREDGLRRLPTADETLAFWADGAVVLRGVLDPGYVASMAPHVDALLALPELVDMTAMGESLARSGAAVLRGEGGAGRFRSGIDHWLVHPEFARFACDSGVPAIAAA